MSVIANEEQKKGSRTEEGLRYLEVLSNLTNQALEGKFADEEFGGFLVTSDFTEGDGTGPETMGLLHTSGGGLQSNQQ
jgi:hypothetical protein